MAKTLQSIYRHLVKGLCQESLQEAVLLNGATLKGDRAFAFQFIDTLTEEQKNYSAINAPWMSKMLLVVQHDFPELAKLIPTWNESQKKLKIKIVGTSLCCEEKVDASGEGTKGREALALFVENFLKGISPYSKARHPQVTPLRLIGSEEFNTRYTDGEKGPISLALRESIQDLEAKFEFPIDEKRFRLNLFLEGAPAWSELAWVGKKLRIGKCLLEIYKPIGRCPNIDVDQKNGARIDEIFPELKNKIGHSLTGIKANIIEGGVIKLGDDWELIENE